MIIQSIGTICSFKANRSYDRKKKECEAKISELQEKEKRLNAELEKVLPKYEHAQIQYIIARENKNKLEHQLRKLTEEISITDNDLSIWQAEYRYLCGKSGQ